MSGGVAYDYNWDGTSSTATWVPAQFDEVGGMIMFLFAALFAAVGRMLLLRWRRGALVALVIGGLIVLAMVCGAHLRYVDMRDHTAVPSPLGPGLVGYMMCAFAGAVVGATCVWGIWLALAHAFLPRRAAVALIEWQRAMSARIGSADRTDATTSVTA